MAAEQAPRPAQQQPEWMTHELEKDPWLRGLAGRIGVRGPERPTSDPAHGVYGDSDSRTDERLLQARTGKPIDTLELNDGDLL